MRNGSESTLSISPSQEVIVPERTERLGSAVSAGFVERFKELSRDEGAKEAMLATTRLGINAIAALLDAVPVVGEAVSMSNLGMKAMKVVAPFLRNIDPTPDVGFGSTALIEVGLAPVEIATGGMLPSFLVNGLRQAQIDYRRGRFDNAVNVVGYLLTGKEHYRQELQDKGLLLDSAANVFLPGEE